jgi:hypothetical protein
MTKITRYKFLRAFRASVRLWLYSLTLIPLALSGAGASGRIRASEVLRSTVAPTPHLFRSSLNGSQTLEQYQGSLAQGGAVLYSYQSVQGGLHEITLSGPIGADFTLSLDVEVIKSGPGRPTMVIWAPVAQSDGTTANEYIAYQGVAQGAQLSGGGRVTGNYRVRVTATQGSGNYTLDLSHP